MTTTNNMGTNPTRGSTRHRKWSLQHNYAYNILSPVTEAEFLPPSSPMTSSLSMHCIPSVVVSSPPHNYNECSSSSNSSSTTADAIQENSQFHLDDDEESYDYDPESFQRWSITNLQECSLPVERKTFVGVQDQGKFKSTPDMTTAQLSATSKWWNHMLWSGTSSHSTSLDKRKSRSCSGQAQDSGHSLLWGIKSRHGSSTSMGSNSTAKSGSFDINCLTQEHRDQLKKLVVY